MSKAAKKQKNLWQKFLGMHEHKKHIEFFTAILSIPVLITIIILNLNSVQNLKGAKPTDTPQQQGNGFYSRPISNPSINPSSQPSGTVTPCKKELGPVGIESPEEGELVNENPVYVIITYPDDEYCAAVWAYRINGGSWSEYDDKSIALYNLPAGNIRFELKAKSLAKTGSERTITRNFVYKDAAGATSTPVPSIDKTDQLGTSSAQ